LLTVAFILALALSTSVSLAQQAMLNPAKGLAVGQNPKLLQNTRDSNAGAGNGGEFVRSSRIDFGSGAHNIKMRCTAQEIDPGNSHEYNKSPECDYVECTLYPQGF
jgi:hypothetical protein